MRAIARLSAGIFAFAISSFAGTIIGGTNLLTNSDVTQLEAWLGEGELTLTNIFDKADLDGKTADDFHANADNRGRTFTIYRLRINDPSSSPFNIIGGYNPRSWNNTDGYFEALTDAQRTAFIFNLTSGIIQTQRLTGDPSGASYGLHQTMNDGNYGPSFGGGIDIATGYDLPDGYLYQYSYGSCAAPLGGCTNILGQVGSPGTELEFAL